MSDIATFFHADCTHFEPCDNPKFPDQGNCPFLAEHLRMELNTPVILVQVDGMEQAADVWTDSMQIHKGCPFFEATEAALDEIADELQSPDERFGVSRND